jgi:predicted DNA-binding transcriptional regulator AlpA
MDIKIPSLEEIEATIEKCLSKHLLAHSSYSDSRKINDSLLDRIGLNEAMEITGLKQSAIYKKTMQGDIPNKKFGKKLIFSRRELEIWMDQNTVRKRTPEEIASKQLAKIARKRINKLQRNETGRL